MVTPEHFNSQYKQCQKKRSNTLRMPKQSAYLLKRLLHRYDVSMPTGEFRPTIEKQMRLVHYKQIAY